MKKLTVFYLEHCPYCQKAKKAVKELESEISEHVEIEWIEESLRPEIAQQYDYYYVPSIFNGKKKLYECSPSDDYGTIKQRFLEAINEV